MNCCFNYIGKFPHNKQINTGLIADAAGEYILELTSAGGNSFELTKNFEIGNDITIEIGELNEMMSYDLKVKKPDLSYFETDNCDIYRLQTFINTQLDGCTEPCDDNSDSPSYYN